MKPRELGRFLRRITGKVVEKERPQRAVVTAIADRDTTGEIVATFSDGRTIYIHAASVYDIGVSDVVYVQKLQVGLARGRYQIAGFHKGSGGSYIPGVRAESLAAVLNDMLTDDSGIFLTDDSDLALVED